MGDTFSFRSFLSGGSNTSVSQPACLQHQYQQQQQQMHQQQQQQPQPSTIQQLYHQQEMTTLNVNIGNECKTFTVPKNTSYKELASTIKDTFGLNTKTTLNIKCENNNGEMFSLASDCHLRKAYKSNSGENSLRLVVKEVQPCHFSNSLFSFFGSFCESNNNNSNNSNNQIHNQQHQTIINDNTHLVVNNNNNSNNHVFSGLSGLSSIEAQSFTNSGASSSVASIAVPAPNFLNRKETLLIDPNLKEQQSIKSTPIQMSNPQSTPTIFRTLSPLHASNHHHPLSGKSSHTNVYGLSSNFSTLSINHGQPFSTSSHHHHYSTNSNVCSKSPEPSSPINIPPPTTHHHSTSPSSSTFGSKKTNPTSPSSTPPSSLRTSLSNQPKVLPPIFPLTNPMKYYPQTNLQQQQPQSPLTSQESLLKSSKSDNNTTTNNSSNMNRNESFEFMQFDDTDSQISSSGIDDDEMDSINTSIPTEAIPSRRTPSVVITPTPTFSTPPSSSIASSSSSSSFSGMASSKEVQEFIMEITKFFQSLRTVTDPEEQKNLKKTICDSIQKRLATMPWILGFFPQLKQFAGDQYSSISVPPNTPPPSPSQQSPLYDMTTKSQVSIFQVPGDLSNDMLNSHLQLQSKIESLMIKEIEEPKLSTASSGKSTATSSTMLASTKLQYAARKIEGPTIHKGFTCSLCTQSPIVGNLYYCATCITFNFCDQCKIQQHPNCPNGQQHSIITVTKSMKSCNMSTPSPSLPGGSPSSSPNTSRRGCPYGRKKFRCPFNLKFLSDVSLPFGSEAHPGQLITKTWRIQNSGSSALPKDCLLVRVCGNARLSKVITMPLPPMNCSEIINVSIPLFIPDIPSKVDEYLVGEFWRVCTSDGYYFGDQLWISLVIRRNKRQDL